MLSTELEALGDDLALDEDTSYLDEVPAPSDTVPGEKDTGGTRTQVLHESVYNHFCVNVCVQSSVSCTVVNSECLILKQELHAVWLNHKLIEGSYTHYDDTRST